MNDIVNNTDKPFYWVAHGDYLTFGILEPGAHLATSQPSFEQFETYFPWRTRVLELGGTFE